jgi:tRNA-dihydrouridine synthase 1
MDDLPLVEQIVRTCAEGLSVPVSVKIRMFPDLQKTLDYARMLERAGASLIAVHGRTREQKKSNGADANWDVIKVRPSLSPADVCRCQPPSSCR